MKHKYGEALSELIPSGFSLDKYENTKTTDANSWLKNIEIRYYIHLYLQDPIDERLWNAMGWNGEFLDETIPQNYIDLNQDSIERGFPLLEPKETTQQDNIRDLEIVRPLSITDVRSLLEDTEKAVSKGADISQNDGISEFTMYGNMGFSCAMVNIHTPEEILIEHFKYWLRGEREKLRISVTQQQKQNIVSQATFRRWHDKRVIAYLDLTQWHALNGTKLKKHHIAQIIFPDETSRNPVDIINKSTEALIEGLFAPETRHALFIQGEHEKWKENS